MREKSEKFVVTFHTTSEAIAMEKGCRQREIPGRLIPVPRQISAGCGLAWICATEDREKLEGFMAKDQLRYQLKGVYFV